MSTIQSDTVQLNGEVTHKAATRDELLRLVACKDRFIAVAGHELRNLLAPVVTSLDMLTQWPDDGQHKELLSVAAQHAKQLSRLIDDLFDGSRLASGKFQLRRESLDVRSIVERSIQAIQPAVELRRQRLLVTRCDSPLWLNADPLRIEQVLVNLLSNAVKFTPKGGCIWFQTRQENGSAVFEVRDSGCGIQPDQLPHIFDFFSQAPDGNGQAPISGLGIGLALVKSLVELHDGTVAARSEGPNCGADFIVRLPLL
jgi:signal transduction histidine kinase